MQNRKRDTDVQNRLLNVHFLCLSHWQVGSLPLSHMGENNEGTCLKTSNRASSDTKSASTLILDFSASRTMRNKWLLLKPPVFVLILVTTAQTDYGSGIVFALSDVKHWRKGGSHETEERRDIHLMLLKLAQSFFLQSIFLQRNF